MSPEFTIERSCEYPLQAAGWGLYQYFIIGIASACAFSQATAFSSVPFAVPLAICDASISEKTVTTIDACFSFGIAIGGTFLTSISDISGRRCLISVTLMMIFGSTFACGFAHGHLMVLMCVFILGSGLAANSNCVKIHLAEILPPEKRGFYLVFPDLFWGFGYLIGGLLSWLLTPSIIEHSTMDMRLTTWRLIFGLSGGFSIMVACASALILPSPRFLLLQKDYPQALDTLKHIYAINNSRHCDTYLMRLQDLDGCINDYYLNTQPPPLNCTEHVVVGAKRIRQIVNQLVSKQFLAVTALLTVTKFMVVFGILAINIWLAKMIEYREEDDCYFKAVDMLHLEESDINCKFHISLFLYRNFFVIALSVILGPVLLLFVIDRLGRKFCLICACVTCGATSFTLGYIHDVYVIQLVTSSFFMLFYTLLDSTLNVVAIESYPTAFRGTAVGGTQFLANLANGFLRIFLHTPCQHSFIFMGALMLAGAVLCFFLPELKERPMVE